MYRVANRDPKRCPDPDKFNPERPDYEHFGWGTSVHVCLFGLLARLEVNLAVEAFRTRQSTAGAMSSAAREVYLSTSTGLETRDER